jgi:hypothetical protein
MNSQDALRRLTNIDEVVRRTEATPDPPQPVVEPLDSPRPLIPHSTVDPLESNFAVVHMADGLNQNVVTRPVRVMAWIFLAGPALVVWLGLLSILVQNWSQVQGPMDIARRIAAFSLVTLGCAFWPYLLLRRRK